MQFPSHRSYSSAEDPRSAARPSSDEPPARERLIPFPARVRDGDIQPRQARRRTDARDGERSNTSAGTRRARRRRHSTPWLQRNALSLAALSLLVALLGFGFGVVQMLNKAEPGVAQAPISATEAAAASAPVMLAASVGSPVSLAMSPVSPAIREIQASAHVIEATYTVESGDTLARIAIRYNTTVERIQAFNNIADARALRIGTRLVIPPPL